MGENCSGQFLVMKALNITIVCMLLFVSAILAERGAKLDAKKRILFYPFANGYNSRLRNMDKIANMVAERGHESYLLVSDIQQKRSLLSDNVHKLTFPAPTNSKVMFVSNTEYAKAVLQKDMALFYKVTTDQQEAFCRSLLEDKATMKQLKDLNFDLMFVDYADQCGRLLIDYIDTNLVMYSNFGWDNSPDIFFPINPSYMPNTQSAYTDVMDYWQRLDNLYLYFKVCVIYGPPLLMTIQNLRKEYGLNSSMSVDNSNYRAKLVFMNSDFTFETPKPLMPNVIPIGGLLNTPGNPLPVEYRLIYEQAGDDGVIIVSFGTLMNVMTRNIIDTMSAAFGNLKQQVIWRLPSELEKPTNVAPNIHLMEWVPQNDLLGTIGTRLFITHGGSSSMSETIYHGVPVVVVPFFMDQFWNTAKMVQRIKMGLELDLNTMTQENLHEAITEVLNNVTYKLNALDASRRFRTQPVQPKDKFFFYLEQLLEHGEMDHLMPHGAIDLAWYQYFMLDIYVPLFVGLYIIFKIIWCFVKFVLCRVIRIFIKQKVE